MNQNQEVAYFEWGHIQLPFNIIEPCQPNHTIFRGTKLYLWLYYDDITTTFNNLLEGDILYNIYGDYYYIITKRINYNETIPTHEEICYRLNNKIKNNLFKVYRKKLNNKDIEMKSLKND